MLDPVRHTTTVAQREKHYMAACGPFFKLIFCEKLRSSTIGLVDLSLLDKAHRHAPIISINANALSNIDKEVHKRAILEFERRFM